MNNTMPLEARLEHLGEELRRQPSLVDPIMVQIRTYTESTGAKQTMPNAPRSPHWRRAAVTFGGVAAIAVAAMFAVFHASVPQVGWAQVQEAMQSKPWIHTSSKLNNGSNLVIWIAPSRHIWAYDLQSEKQFFNGKERVVYTYRKGRDVITKFPIAADAEQRVLPLTDLADNKATIAPWLFGNDKVVSQSRSEVTENGKTWIEFQMQLWLNKDRRATLRVDPETRLPVYLLLTFPDQKTAPIKYVFDFPADGPIDIYALGAPRDAKIDDHVPDSKAMAVLDAMSAQRAKLDNYRLFTEVIPDGSFSIVSRKGNCWRVDRGVLGKRDANSKSTTDDADQPLSKRIEAVHRTPQYICDGATVWENQQTPQDSEPKWQVSKYVAPQDLSSGNPTSNGGIGGTPYANLSSLILPDLMPLPGWIFRCQPQTSDPNGVIQIQLSCKNTVNRFDGATYFIDPARGYAANRIKYFSRSANAPLVTADDTTETWGMDAFEEAKPGFWYPRTLKVLRANGKVETTVSLSLQFDIEMPETLFATPNSETK